MGKRQDCSHATETSSITVVRWCVRCSGWRYYSWAESSEASLDMPPRWFEVTSGFWPSEETGPDEALAMITRLLRTTQEAEVDARRVY